MNRFERDAQIHRFIHRLSPSAKAFFLEMAEAMEQELGVSEGEAQRMAGNVGTLLQDLLRSVADQLLSAPTEPIN